MGLNEEKPSPSILVTIGSPLTPIDGVELSTPNKPAICCVILVEDIGPDDDNISLPKNIIILTDEEIKKIKVDVLKEELRTRGLSHAGKKVELVERLKKSDGR